MRRRRLMLGAGACAFLALAAIGWLALADAPDVPTAVVERGTFVDAVQIRGEV